MLQSFLSQPVCLYPYPGGIVPQIEPKAVNPLPPFNDGIITVRCLPTDRGDKCNENSEVPNPNKLRVCEHEEFQEPSSYEPFGVQILAAGTCGGGSPIGGLGGDGSVARCGENYLMDMALMFNQVFG